jgi:hypothetical protein
MPTRVNRLLLLGGLRRGLLEGSRPWMVLGALAGLMRLLGRMKASDPEVVYCEELGQGESIVISHLPSVRPARRRDAKMEA